MNPLVVFWTLLYGFSDRPYASSELAAFIHRVRLEVARDLLEQWEESGAAFVALRGSRVVPMKEQSSRRPTWLIFSPEALQLLAASLAEGVTYLDAGDPIGAGPGVEWRARHFRDLAEKASRVAVTVLLPVYVDVIEATLGFADEKKA